jgi:hypothetical protein
MEGEVHAHVLACVEEGTINILVNVPWAGWVDIDPLLSSAMRVKKREKRK